MSNKNLITVEELQEWFGPEMPVEALQLIEKGMDKGWPIARLRCELRVLAGLPVMREDLEHADVPELKLTELFPASAALALIIVVVTVFLV